MRLREFLQDRLLSLIGRTLFVMIASLFLIATGTQTGIVLLVIIAWSMVEIITQGYAFYIQRNHLRSLAAIMEGLEQKYLFTECIDAPCSLYEQYLFALTRQAGRAMIGAVSDAQAAGRDYREYIESWVHEIKTPITAAVLISHNASPDVAHKLDHELAQITDHVERALFYARAESPEKDLLIRPTPLADIVTQTIVQHQSLLMQSNVQIVTDDLSPMVYTDSKWVIFMLGQLLQNAVRYRSDAPLITLSAQILGDQVRLVVQDNGIGIPAHDLPRVFERGFTGSNGRIYGNSTGMGLYLCRRLAERLNIDLAISSTLRQGTTVTLTFASKNMTKM